MNADKLQITLTKQDNVLDGLTCYEYVDKTILYKLIHSTLLKETFNNKMASFYDNEKKQLQCYYENGNDHDGVFKVKVEYNKCRNNAFGRSNPNNALGLYSIRREIRHTLCSDNYIDIDVKNCHPTMLLQICKANDIKHTELEKYVNNRTSYFEHVIENYGCDEEQAKNLFIIYLYGGGIDKWVEKTKST